MTLVYWSTTDEMSTVPLRIQLISHKLFVIYLGYKAENQKKNLAEHVYFKINTKKKQLFQYLKANLVRNLTTNLWSTEDSISKRSKPDLKERKKQGSTALKRLH